MKPLIVFIQKEIIEQIRTYKTLILMIVFFILGMISPITAKMMPDLLSSMDVGFEIKIPEPTFWDAYAQFFKNVPQMGIMIVLLVFSGVVSLEKTKNSIILMLTKGLSRWQFIIAKFIAMLLLWTSAYLAACGALALYTYLLFPNASFDYLVVSLFCLWLFVDLLLAITLCASTFVTSPYVGTILAFAGWFGLLLSKFIPGFANDTPSLLATCYLGLMTHQMTLGDLFVPILLTLIFILFFIGGAIGLLKRSEL